MTYDTTAAWHDLSAGLANWTLWSRLGWQEVKRRYRRTAIGPFWTSLSLAVLVVVLGVVWSGLWGQEVGQYLPFLCSGLTTWLLISSIISEGCAVFIGGEGLIKQLRFDYSVLAVALIWRNLIVFGHNVVVYLVIAITFQTPLTGATLLLLPGLALIAVNGLWIAILFGLACLRFRDVQQLVTSLLQISMLVTPIFWSADKLGQDRLLLVDLNPLYHLIEIVRAPLLGEAPTYSTYVAVAAITVLGWGLTFAAFSRFRSRIAYWS